MVHQGGQSWVRGEQPRGTYELSRAEPVDAGYAKNACGARVTGALRQVGASANASGRSLIEVTGSKGTRRCGAAGCAVFRDGFIVGLRAGGRGNAVGGVAGWNQVRQQYRRT